ncbi:MAG: AmmeMemoRadiSam system protein B [Pseudomonadales bacterium]|nr:AmmeMemoRadiSam system protein B [Pseudomonadales bacterium]
MSSIRTPAVAGMFYPAEPGTLVNAVEGYLAAANDTLPAPKALIAPHAGYIYSGPIAAEVYAPLKKVSSQIKRVVLLGPSHRVGFRGIAMSSASEFETPLGLITLDKQAMATISELPGVITLDQAHAQEHSLEVQLPFLQTVLTDFTLVPLVVGDASPDQVARVLETLWGGDDTLIVISSDLSHYHDYATAQQTDQNTTRKIEALNPSLRGEEACGCRPINGLITLARNKGWKLKAIDVRNSGDTAGDRNRVVGYGAYILTGNDAMTEPKSTLNLAQRQQLIQLARNAIFHPFTSKENFHIELTHYDEGLRQDGASFVTLNLNGQLRGCIGSLQAHKSLLADVASNAQSAAFRDPRFAPLTLGEYQLIDVHISVLSTPVTMNVTSRDDLIQQLRPGVDGLIIEENGHRATYLPSVWEQLKEPEVFVRELRRKAGLSGDGWNTQTRCFRYSTEEFC